MSKNLLVDFGKLWCFISPDGSIEASRYSYLSIDPIKINKACRCKCASLMIPMKKNVAQSDWTQKESPFQGSQRCDK